MESPRKRLPTRRDFRRVGTSDDDTGGLVRVNPDCSAERQKRKVAE